MKSYEDWQQVKLNTKLEDACHKGYVEVVEVLLSQGANINYDNNSSISFACARGHLEVVKLLIDRGADIASSKGEHLLNVAIVNGCLDVAHYLVGLNLFGIEHHKYALSAAESGFITMIDYMGSLGVDVFQSGFALKKVAASCSYDVFKRLFRIEDIKGDVGFDIICQIANRGEEESIQYALKEGVCAKLLKEKARSPSSKMLMFYDIMIERQEFAGLYSGNNKHRAIGLTKL